MVVAPHAFDPLEPTAPTDDDRKLAAESLNLLTQQLDKSAATIRLQVSEESGSELSIPIPTTASRLLVAILAEMAGGNAVRLVPHRAELTTQDAANLLNVSRPYLVRLLDEGRIPHHKVGTHRRILFEDVMAYRAEHRRARNSTLDELTRLSQELGLY